jgi:hypothetical protein
MNDRPPLVQGPATALRIKAAEYRKMAATAPMTDIQACCCGLPIALTRRRYPARPRCRAGTRHAGADQSSGGDNGHGQGGGVLRSRFLPVGCLCVACFAWSSRMYPTNAIFCCDLSRIERPVNEHCTDTLRLHTTQSFGNVSMAAKYRGMAESARSSAARTRRSLSHSGRPARAECRRRPVLGGHAVGAFHRFRASPPRSA